MMAVPAITHAQPEPPPEIKEADRLFEEGRLLAKDKNWKEACDRFDRSYRLDPSIGTTLNLADCHEQLGHLRQAWTLFEQAAKESAQTPEVKRTTLARERADAVATKLALVVVHVPQPAPVGLTIGGRSIAISTDIRDRVEPGDVEVVATFADRPRFATTIKAMAGATVVVDVPAVIAATPVPIDKPDAHRRRVRIAWTVGGVGAASAIVATALTLSARSSYNKTADGSDCMRVDGGITCNDAGDRAIADAQGRADLGTGFAIGAIALLGTGAVLYFTAPREPSVQVAPVAIDRGGGVTIRGRF